MATRKKAVRVNTKAYSNTGHVGVSDQPQWKSFKVYWTPKPNAKPVFQSVSYATRKKAVALKEAVALREKMTGKRST